MDRREVLLSLGTVGISSLAGCSGGGSDTEYTTQDGPPYFEKIRLSGPESVEVGESFDINVTAANTGGRTGNFTATLSVGEGPFTLDKGVKVANIEPGYDKSAETGPFSVGYAGSYTFKITDYAARYEVKINPMESEVGDSVTLWNDVEVAPRKVKILQSLTEKTDDGDRLHFPENGDFFVIASISVDNLSSSEVFLSSTLSFESLQTVNPGQDNILSGSPDYAEITGSRLGPLEAGEAGRRYLLAEADRGNITGDISIIAQRDGSDTPPEIRWTDSSDGESRDLPDFSLQNLEGPDSVEIGEKFSFGATVMNKGDSSATFKGLVRSRNDLPDWEGWRRNEVVNKSVPAGDSVTISKTFSEPLTGPSVFQLLPFDQTVSIDFVPARRHYGEYYEMDAGLRTTVDDLETASSISPDSDWKEPSEASSGMQWLLAKVIAINDADEDLYAPDPDELTAQTDTEAFSAIDPLFYDEIVNPVSGSWYDPGYGDMDSHSREAGWVAFEVPSEYDGRDFSIELLSPSDLGDEVAVSIIWEPMNA